MTAVKLKMSFTAAVAMWEAVSPYEPSHHVTSNRTSNNDCPSLAL